MKPGVPIDHLRWIGRYIAEKFHGRKDVTIVHLGDHWDMPSLSSYDKGKKQMEGRRYHADIEAGNLGFRTLDEPILAVQADDRLAKRKLWKPRKVLLRGNHENRIQRAIDADAQLDGVLTLDALESPGWEVHEFLVPVRIDGVTYAHYFYNPMSGNPFTGMIETRLKNMGHSFTQGHQQTLAYGLRPVPAAGGFHHGLVAGACYLHDEDYKGPQGNSHWRGIIVKHEVRDGQYDPMFVSLNFLCLRYEGKPLSEFKPKMIA